MPTNRTNSEFSYFMHEGPDAFSFELSGILSRQAEVELEKAREMAAPILRGRSLSVDLSYVTHLDPEARTMLREWHDAGAELVAKSSGSRAVVASITGDMEDSVPSVAHHHTWRPFYTALWSLVLAAFIGGRPAMAADLKPETVQAWNSYVLTVKARHQQYLSPGSAFLSVDEFPAQMARLRNGEILLSAVDARVPLKVPSGLIHDWIATAFIPRASLADVMHVVRDYDCYKDVYHPNVVDSRAIAGSGSSDRYSLLIMNKAFFTRTALDTEYQSAIVKLDDRHWYSIAEATRIQEVAGYGTPSAHTLPENQGTGLIWRLYSVARYEETEGGVIVELEAVALSRDIPPAIRWMVEPVVRRVSRSSLATSLRQTQRAVQSASRNSTVAGIRP